MPFTPHYTRKARPTRGRTLRTRGPRRAAADLSALETYYNGLSGFQVSLTGMEGYKTTYGEVTPEGIKALEGVFQATTPTSSLPQSRRVFYDLGCGVGKVVLGIAMLHPELRAVGLEIVSDRIAHAHTALSRAGSGRRGLAGRVSFRTTSFLTPETNLADAGWIYISNLCFDEETQKGIAEKLEAECAAGTVMICSKQMPFSEGGHWQKVGDDHKVPMSWSAESKCYVYRCGAAAAGTAS